MHPGPFAGFAIALHSFQPHSPRDEVVVWSANQALEARREEPPQEAALGHSIRLADYHVGGLLMARLRREALDVGEQLLLGLL